MEAKRFVLRKVAGENILVPVGNTALTFNGLVTLNESGAFLWKHMEKTGQGKSWYRRFCKNMKCQKNRHVWISVNFLHILQKRAFWNEG